MEKSETVESIEKLSELVVDFLTNLSDLYENNPVRISTALERTVTHYIAERVKKDKREQFLGIFCNNLRANVANLEIIDYDAAEEAEV